VQAQLVVSRREGRNRVYSPSFERMNDLVGFLTEKCYQQRRKRRALPGYHLLFRCRVVHPTNLTM